MTSLRAVTATEAPVPPGLVTFLTRLAVALHKMRAYPAGHPMREDAIGAAAAALQAALEGRDAIRFAVARHQLLIDGAGTDPAHFVLRDLASRLRRLHLGAIVFRSGATGADLVAALDQLLVDPGRSVPAAARTFESSAGVELVPVTFGALSLDRRSGANSRLDGVAAADALWQSLASLALHGHRDRRPGKAGDQSGEEDSESLLREGSESLARALVERLRSVEGRVVAGRTVEQLGRLASSLEGEARQRAEVRLRDLLAALPPESLNMLLAIDFDRPDTADRLAAAAEWLPAVALLDLVEAAARARKQEISTFLMRLLRKLAGQGGAPTRQREETPDFRNVMRQLLEGWTLESPNPTSHTRVLDLLSARDQGSGAERFAGEGLRIVQMALETGAVGDQVEEGVELALEAGDLGPMLQALEQEPEGAEAAAAVWSALTRPAALREICLAGQPDVTAVRRLVGRIGADGVGLLLDLAIGSEDPAVRSLLLERVVGFGPRGIREVVARIRAVPPPLQRALLALLVGLEQLPETLDVSEMTASPEPMVRLEAYRLMLRIPDARDDAMHAALSEADERIARLAIDAGLTGLPRQSLSRLMLLLSNPKRSAELQARAVPILAQFEGPSIRHWLTEGMTVRRGWFRLTRLAPKTPLVVARIRLLVARWPDDPDTRRIRRLARRSGDAELISAGRGLAR